MLEDYIIDSPSESHFGKCYVVVKCFLFSYEENETFFGKETYSTSSSGMCPFEKGQTQGSRDDPD